MSSNTDPELNSLVNQLKDVTSVNKQVANTKDEICRELNTNPKDIEEFVVANSSKLINHSLQAIDEVKDYIMASGDPDSISALSELIRASSGALDSLNKIVVQNKRAEQAITVKQMDHTSKNIIEDKRNDNALIASREEIFKKILNDAKVITIEGEDLGPSPETLDQQS